MKTIQKEEETEDMTSEIEYWNEKEMKEKMKENEKHQDRWQESLLVDIETRIDNCHEKYRNIDSYDMEIDVKESFGNAIIGYRNPSTPAVDKTQHLKGNGHLKDITNTMVKESKNNRKPVKI